MRLNAPFHVCLASEWLWLWLTVQNGSEWMIIANDFDIPIIRLQMCNVCNFNIPAEAEPTIAAD